MRHRMKGRRLGRSSKHRRALGSNLVAALFEHGRITTTLPKAKEYRAMAEKLVTLGKIKTVPRIRQATARLHRRDVVSRLFDDIGPAFKDRPGGYTRIVRLPGKRLGDKGQTCFLELVNHVPVRKAPEKDEAAAKKPAGKPEKEAKAKGGKPEKAAS